MTTPVRSLGFLFALAGMVPLGAQSGPVVQLAAGFSELAEGDAVRISVKAEGLSGQRVVLVEGATLVAGGELNLSGEAELVVRNLAPGQHRITARLPQRIYSRSDVVQVHVAGEQLPPAAATDFWIAASGEQGRRHVQVVEGRLAVNQQRLEIDGALAAAAVDADLDGRMDLMVATREELLLLVARLDGTYDPAVKLARWPESVQAMTNLLPGDWNGDGRLDVLLGTDTGVELWVAGRESGLERRFRETAYRQPVEADVNGDDVPDVLVERAAAAGKSEPWVWMGTGVGSFVPLKRQPEAKEADALLVPVKGLVETRLTASIVGVTTAASFALTNNPTPVCGVSLDRANNNVAADPATVLLVVTAPGTCSWTAQSDVPWANFIVSTLGEVRNTLTLSGTRTLLIDVRRNTSSVARSGTIVVNDAVLTINQAGSTDASNLRFLNAIFNNVLGREPGQAGVDFFLPLLNSGTLGQSRMAYNMLSAAEFNLVERYVVGLYYGILGRDPDYYGWDFHRRNMHLGVVQQDTLARDFLNSAEYALRYGNPTNSGFVLLMYQNALGRTPSAPDLAYWQGLLDSGTATRVQVAQAILNSPEFQQGHSTRQTVFLMHATMLSREPGDFGYQYWTDSLNGGMPLLTAVNAFIQSPEFQIKLGPVGRVPGN